MYYNRNVFFSLPCNPSLANTDEYCVGVDRWISALRALDPSLAARTVSVSITVADARALLRHHELDPLDPTCADADRFKSLSVRLCKAMQSVGTDAAFVKLSTRSAKDVVYDEQNATVDKLLTRCLNRCMKRRLSPGPAAELQNPKRLCDTQFTVCNRAALESVAVEAWLEACAGAFKCCSVDDALSHLLRSTRINVDINRALDSIPGALDAVDAEDDDDNVDRSILQKVMPITILARAWHQTPVPFEFRGFVYGGRLRALSQYYVRKHVNSPKAQN